MPARIVLKVIDPALPAREIVFDERTTCIVGRGKDCEVSLPNDAEHRGVSRHHCLFDINPPDIRIRDFGSLNGTFLKGADTGNKWKKLGQREPGQKQKEASHVDFPEYDLKDGDEIRLGKTFLQVAVYMPVVCAVCWREFAGELRRQVSISTLALHCDACVEKARAAARAEPGQPQFRKCAHCGRSVTAEIGRHRAGDYTCHSCHADPLKTVRLMLESAKRCDQDLVAIKNYAIEKELGRGGMGAVYLARHEQTGARVALKVMLPKVAASEWAVEVFRREVENTAALRHPNVVQLLESDSLDGVFFFTLELCNLGSVSHLLERRGGKLSIAEAVPLMLQVLKGLEFAHQAPVPNVRLKDGSYRTGTGLVHRDLKPHNILLRKSGSTYTAKVGDFGLAKAFDAAGLSGQTMTGGGASGTPKYMSRDQMRNFKYAKPNVDVWAAAATLYRMLTGTVPRDFDAKTDIWQTVLECDAVPIRTRDRSIPTRLAEVIDAALVEEPQMGFQSAAELRRALEDAL